MVVHRGVVGIVEVHGEPYHPPSRAAHDHKRNLFFRESGIVVEVFDAQEVRENTKFVVDKFLALLRGPTR